MDHGLYQTGQFAKLASVTERTLRFYDKAGLLSPSCRTAAGYRLYTEADLIRLQRILALKFLGFSLEEIRQCLRIGPIRLQASLAQQKRMLRERRAQLEAVIQAIEKTEALLDNGHSWEAIINVIQVIQMQETGDWRKKYFTDEQLQQMEEWSKKYYTPEQRRKLAEWGKPWTEQDQLEANQQWSTVQAELKRLVAAGSDPASPEAQALVRQWRKLVNEFTHGDAGIAASLRKMYEDISALPPGQAPYALPFTAEEGAFLHKALEVLEQQEPAQ